MNLKSSLLIAVLLGFIFITSWELYVREQGYASELDDNKALWAVNRAKVESLQADDVILLGSSRVHFNIQLDEWEALTGRRPIMLASDGSTPTPVFKDIVENTSFNGTILIGIAPKLFFSTPDKGFMWNRAATRVEHYYDRTYAQKANHYLSIPLERSFSFLNASEEQWSDDIDLKTLVNNIRIGHRGKAPNVPFNNFGFVDEDRNITMFEKTKTDTAFANTIITAWATFDEGAPPPVIEPIISYYNKHLTPFIARGGKVIFLRSPSNGSVRERERENVPREKAWDVFTKAVNQPSYHFEDYPKLSQFICPEESHLYTPDAQTFTTEFVRILMADQHISKSN